MSCHSSIKYQCILPSSVILLFTSIHPQSMHVCACVRVHVCMGRIQYGKYQGTQFVYATQHCLHPFRFFVSFRRYCLFSFLSLPIFYYLYLIQTIQSLKWYCSSLAILRGDYGRATTILVVIGNVCSAWPTEMST